MKNLTLAMFLLLCLPLQALAQDNTSSIDAVEEKNLGEISFDGIGLINQSEGGLPAGMWQGSDAAFTSLLIDTLPQTQSVEINSVKKRLLVSSAQKPDNFPGHNIMFFSRLKQLAYMGASTEISNMLRKIPDSYKTEQMDAAYVLSLFAAQNYKDACKASQNEFLKYNNMQWRKIILACHADSGKKNDLDLALKLLKEDNKTIDETFKKLLNQLQNKDKSARKDFLKSTSQEIFPSKQLQHPLPQIQEKFTEIPADKLSNLITGIDNIADNNKKIIAIARLYALLESLGEKISEKQWQEIATYCLANNIKVPSFVWTTLLQYAIDNKRQGETALLLIHLVGEEQLTNLSPELLRWAIYATDEIGLKQDAGKILVEAMGEK